MTDYARLIADELDDYDIVRHVLTQLGVRDSLDAEIDAHRCDQPGSPHQLAVIVRRYHQEQQP